MDGTELAVANGCEQDQDVCAARSEGCSGRLHGAEMSGRMPPTGRIVSTWRFMVGLWGRRIGQRARTHHPLRECSRAPSARRRFVMGVSLPYARLWQIGGNGRSIAD